MDLDSQEGDGTKRRYSLRTVEIQWQFMRSKVLRNTDVDC